MLRSSWRQFYVLERTCRDYLPTAQHRNLSIVNLRSGGRSHHQTASTVLSGISDDFANFGDGGSRASFNSNKQSNGRDSDKKPNGNGEERVSDEEWELRTGEVCSLNDWVKLRRSQLQLVQVIENIPFNATSLNQTFT